MGRRPSADLSNTTDMSRWEETRQSEDCGCEREDRGGRVGAWGLERGGGGRILGAREMNNTALTLRGTQETWAGVGVWEGEAVGSGRVASDTATPWRVMAAVRVEDCKRRPHDDDGDEEGADVKDGLLPMAGGVGPAREDEEAAVFREALQLDQPLGLGARLDQPARLLSTVPQLPSRCVFPVCRESVPLVRHPLQTDCTESPSWSLSSLTDSSPVTCTCKRVAQQQRPAQTSEPGRGRW